MVKNCGIFCLNVLGIRMVKNCGIFCLNVLGISMVKNCQYLKLKPGMS